MRLLFVFILASTLVPIAAGAEEPTRTAHSIVHLLDYVTADYAAVVKDGQVSNETEYKEQQEFTAQVVQLVRGLAPAGAQRDLVTAAEGLADAVSARQPPEEVALLARRISQRLMQDFAVETSPAIPPDLVLGARVFAENCTRCHGATGHGDGPEALTLNPHPANFHDSDRQSLFSAFGLYSTISLGIEGTAMPAFNTLDDHARWSLAFYIGSMGFTEAVREQGEELWKQGQLHDVFPNLTAVTNTTLRDTFTAHGADGVAVLTYLRSAPSAFSSPSGGDAINVSITRLKESVAHYQAGRHEEAYQFALSAYLDGFEPVEPALRLSAPELRTTVEKDMLSYRDAIKRNAPVDVIVDQAAQLESLLLQAQQRIGDKKLSAGMSAASAFLLLVREGLEAILVLAAVIAFLTKTNRRHQLVYVHVGWISAVVLGLITWIVANSMLTLSGATRELTEGITALVAAGMLIYVGYWLHRNSQAQRWKSYITEKLHESSNGRAIWTLGTLSFIAVYREMFETILFFQTLWVQGDSLEHRYVVGGALAGAVALGMVAWLLFRYSVRLPLQQFFTANAVLLYVLAIVFAGKGIVGLQEAGKLPLTRVNFPEIDLLGIYPDLQSLALQGTLIIAAIAWLAYERATTRQANT